MVFKFHRSGIAVAVLAAYALPAAAAVESKGEGPSRGKAELATVAVTAEAAGETATGPVKGYVVQRSAAGMKTDTPLIETPQSVSVITRDRIEDYGARSVNEALSYSAGVSTYGASSRSDWYTYVRGFSPNVYLDGLKLPVTKNAASWIVEPYLLERIELLRGPASVLYGQGDPGGTVNLVSKKPALKPVREIELGVGNHGHQRLGLDLGGAIDENGEWSYRLVGFGRSEDLPTGPHASDRVLLAPSLTWRPSAATRLTLQAGFLKDDTDSSDNFLPAQGTVLPNPNGKISRDLYTGDPGFSRYKKEQQWLGYQFEHRFDDALAFRQNLLLSKLDVDNNSVYGWGLSPLDPSRRTLFRLADIFNTSAERVSLDNQLEARFATGSVRHTLLAGLDYQQQKLDEVSRNIPRMMGLFAPLALDLFRPVYQPITADRFGPQTNKSEKQEQLGLYLQDQLSFGPRWTAVLGLRHDRADTHTDTTGASLNKAERDDSATTGRIGLVYQAGNGFAPYVGYSTSFLPYFQSNPDGSTFEPSRGKQYEAGVKYQPEGGRTSLTTAIWDLVQSNVLTGDPDALRAAAGYQVQTGKVRSRGFEVEAAAEVTRQIKLIASYTYQDVGNIEANGPAKDQRPTDVPTPRNIASLWGSYRFGQGVLNGLGFGLGARYVGSTQGARIDLATLRPADYKLDVPSYTLFDAAVYYETGPWRFAVNAQNLADEEYVSGCQSDRVCFYGKGRSVVATARYRW
ncbi:TonB-dependent siderophore receptor [Crenobacter cavernae]|uniref:TonB-dependent siderophore receptor n=1 Tax=Crenobacter cavernae TaxID=2290923 RepID=A0A345Y8A4_9NEIS|nr:TonB-dependent siderophore receptor [Crenobacter cavernae]AXK40156.1 TonB-dependent siderophore receptor [Crenobacter cavernae]